MQTFEKHSVHLNSFRKYFNSVKYFTLKSFDAQIFKFVLCLVIRNGTFGIGAQCAQCYKPKQNK